MTLSKATIASLRSSTVLLFPLALWVMVWLGLKSGSIEELFESTSPYAHFMRVRATLPLLAGFLGIVIVLAKLYSHRSWPHYFIAPLGLTAAYGLVGLAGAFRSPDGSVAVYWAAIYLSVPLVLWGITWRDDARDTVLRIINLNWLIIVLSVTILFVVALLYLHLGSLILTPSAWFNCELNANWRGESWYALTSKVLRPTGVGRYAALAGIIALGGLWQGQRRSLWFFVLLVSLILLLTSGARGAFLGTAGAVPMVVLLHGGKKALIAGILSLLILVPLFWATGIHQQFLDECIFRTGRSLPFWVSSKINGPESPPSQQGVVSDPGVKPAQQSASNVGEQESSSSEVDVSTPAAPSGPLLTGKQSASDNEQAGSASALGSPAATSGPLSNGKQGASDLILEQPSGTGKQEPNKPGPTEPSRAFAATSGRTAVWAAGIELFKGSPWLGYGFQADRLLLRTHMHNSYIHALIQSGAIGTLLFTGALLYGCVLLYKALRSRGSLPTVHRHLLIQVAGVFTFLLIRSFPESTGAFFGVDWFILAPILLYLWVINHAPGKLEVPA